MEATRYAVQKSRPLQVFEAFDTGTVPEERGIESLRLALEELKTSRKAEFPQLTRDLDQLHTTSEPFDSPTF
jgi:hypothetical protein